VPQSHDLKVRGSNPLPATNLSPYLRDLHDCPANSPGDCVSVSDACPKNARPRVILFVFGSASSCSARPAKGPHELGAMI
jgi:hypothetical protein